MVKNTEAYAELIQFLDNKSLPLVTIEAVDDGREALQKTVTKQLLSEKVYQ